MFVRIVQKTATVFDMVAVFFEYLHNVCTLLALLGV